MSDIDYKFNFNLLKVSFWVTIFLAIMKLSNVIDISIWWVFSPMFIAIGFGFFVIFLIGLITLFLIEMEDDKKTDSEENE